jgi:hypothetical protein
LLEQDNPKAMARTRFTTTLFAALKAAIANFKGRALSASRSAGRRRRVISAPPVCLDLRHSFEGVIRSFASGRKRERRSAISLKAITDCPEVLALSLRMRLDPECERRSLIGHDREYRAGNASQRRGGRAGALV